MKDQFNEKNISSQKINILLIYPSDVMQAKYACVSLILISIFYRAKYFLPPSHHPLHQWDMKRERESVKGKDRERDIIVERARG